MLVYNWNNTVMSEAPESSGQQHIGIFITFKRLWQLPLAYVKKFLIGLVKPCLNI